MAVAAAVDEAPAVQPAAQPPAEVASEAIVVTRTVSPAPTLEVNIPRPGSLVTQPWVVLVGATEPGTFVAVGAQEADVAVDGRWTLGLALQEGANRITVTATDRTGQFTQNTFTVYFEKGAETPAGSPPACCRGRTGRGASPRDTVLRDVDRRRRTALHPVIHPPPPSPSIYVSASSERRLAGVRLRCDARPGPQDKIDAAARARPRGTIRCAAAPAGAGRGR